MDDHTITREHLIDIDEIKGPPLLEIEKRATAINESCLDAIIVIDGTGVMTYVNHAAEKIFGYTAPELIGKRLHHILVSDQARELYNKKLPHFERTGQCVVVGTRVEMNATHKDGTRFPCEISISAFKIGDQWHSAGHVRNISDRRRAEAQLKASIEEKEILLKEIHHRVKNNMAVVSSLISLHEMRLSAQSNKEDTATILQDLRSRISSMTIIHDLLYRSSSLAHLNFEKYANELVGELRRSYLKGNHQIKFTVNAKDVRISLDQALPCALTINELVTNSLKYAFPEGGQGEIGITARPVNGNNIEIVVHDNGVGSPMAVDENKSAAMGLRLVRNLVERQLKGHLGMSQQGRGTRFTMVFPQSDDTA